MPRPLSICWSESVTEAESGLIIEAVRFVLSWLMLRKLGMLPEDEPIPVRVFGYWIMPALVPDQPYWGVQWYTDSSYDRDLKQIIAPTLLELVRKEPWQRAEPHFDLMVLDQDLTDFPAPLARLRRNYYSLGTSLPGTAAVISLSRLRRLSDDNVRAMALQRLVWHHLGHVLGVPSFRRQEAVVRRGLETHCTAPCVMRHANTLESLVELALEEAERGWPFCERCTRDLLSTCVEHSHDWS